MSVEIADVLAAKAALLGEPGQAWLGRLDAIVADVQAAGFAVGAALGGGSEADARTVGPFDKLKDRPAPLHRSGRDLDGTGL